MEILSKMRMKKKGLGICNLKFTSDLWESSLTRKLIPGRLTEKSELETSHPYSYLHLTNTPLKKH